MEKVTVSKAFGSYNGRRYGRPWMARIKSFTGRPELEFQKYVYNGSDNGGEVAFEAEVGEVVRIGQKDFRGNNTMNDFYRVTVSGLEKIDDPVNARKAWEEWQDARQ